MGSDSFSGVPYPSVEPCPYCTCQGKTPVCINGVCKCLTCQKLGDSAARKQGRKPKQWKEKITKGGVE